MISHQLGVFLCVADCGSFNKAAEKLYISATAVMKQINALESRLNVTLFARTPHGIRLTPAGEVIYQNGISLQKKADQALEEAKKAARQTACTLRVGSSLLNPCKVFMDLWYHVSSQFPEFKINIIPFDDEHTGILSVLDRIGVDFDFLIGVCDSASWLERCDMLKLGVYKKCVAVPMDHPLAAKKKLKITDLYGETLMMVKKGDSPLNDRLREDLTKNHPQITIEDTDHYYDISVYNRCVQSGNLLLNLECWKEIHPGLVTLPVEWDYAIPYGILYAKNPSKEVSDFLQAVRKVIDTDETFKK